MNELVMFITLMALGLACYGLFFKFIKWFEKI